MVALRKGCRIQQVVAEYEPDIPVVVKYELDPLNRLVQNSDAVQNRITTLKAAGTLDRVTYAKLLHLKDAIASKIEAMGVIFHYDPDGYILLGYHPADRQEFAVL